MNDPVKKTKTTEQKKVFANYLSDKDLPRMKRGVVMRNGMAIK